MRWVLCIAVTRSWPCQFLLDEYLDNLIQYTSTQGVSSVYILFGINDITPEQASEVERNTTNTTKFENCKTVTLSQPFRGQGKAHGYSELFQQYHQISKGNPPSSNQEPSILIFGTQEMRWRVPEWDIRLERAMNRSHVAVNTAALWVLSTSTSKWDSQGLVVAMDPEHHPTKNLFPANYPGGTEPLLDLVVQYEARTWIPWKRTDSWVVPKHPLELSFHIVTSGERGKSGKKKSSVEYGGSVTYQNIENECDVSSFSEMENFVGEFRQVANFTGLSR